MYIYARGHEWKKKYKGHGMMRKKRDETICLLPSSGRRPGQVLNVRNDLEKRSMKIKDS